SIEPPVEGFVGWKLRKPVLVVRINAMVNFFDPMTTLVSDREKVAGNHLFISELRLSLVLCMSLYMMFNLIVVYFADVEVQLDEFKKSHS
ncbi:hypothetical protein, partial [Neolewinella antarctica]